MCQISKAKWIKVFINHQAKHQKVLNATSQIYIHLCI